MILGFIPRWVAEENPEFARAVSEYYSLEHGMVKNAARGELAWDAMAAKFLLTHAVFRDADPAFYGPFVNRVVSHAMGQMEALQRGDANYFRCRAAALEALPGSGAEDMRLREFIFEAFCFLRKRDGEGSPLPYKDDVKRFAALFMAFVNLKLTAKLRLYLWENRGLTDAQSEKVLQKQKYYLEMSQWTYHLSEAGLGKLRRRPRGGRPRKKQV